MTLPPEERSRDLKAEGVFETRWSVKYTVMRSVFYGFGQGRIGGMLQQRRLHDDSPLAVVRPQHKQQQLQAARQCSSM